MKEGLPWACANATSCGNTATTALDRSAWNPQTRRNTAEHYLKHHAYWVATNKVVGLVRAQHSGCVHLAKQFIDASVTSVIRLNILVHPVGGHTAVALRFECMHNLTATQQLGREAAWPGRLSSLCPSEAAYKSFRRTIPSRASSLVVLAYVLQRNAGTHSNGVAHQLEEITAPSVNIVHIKRQSLFKHSDLADIVHKVPSFKCKVSWEACLCLCLAPKLP